MMFFLLRCRLRGHRMCTRRCGSGVVEHRCRNCIAFLDVMVMSWSPLLMSIPCRTLLSCPPVVIVMM